MSGKNSLTCGDCQKTFTRKCSLSRHMKTVHIVGENSENYECNVCPRKFSRYDNLKRHIKSHQNPASTSTHPRLVCPECSAEFKRKYHLDRHLKTHQKSKVSKATSPVNRAVGDKDIENYNSPSVGAGPSRSSVPNLQEPTACKNVDECLQRYDSSIQTKYTRRKVIDILNINVTKPDDIDITDALTQLWERVKCRFKINVSPGFIISHKITGEHRYIHSSSNNTLLLDKSVMIKSYENLKDFIKSLSVIDIFDKLVQGRPNSEYKVEMLCNLTFFVYKINHMGKIGSGQSLPQYIVKHKAIAPLHKKKNKLFRDRLCFFRCLAMHLDCTCPGQTCRCLRVKERRVKDLFTRYKRKRELVGSAKRFKGVGIRDLLTLEKLFNVSITVFQLEPDLTSNVLWSSKVNYPSKLRLNLHGNHFSLIKRLDWFAKAYDCLICAGSFTTLFNLRRHCCSANKDRLKFPSRCFAPEPTIFELLESEFDIYVEPERRIFPHRITYDIECFLPGHNVPAKTNTLTYINEHKLLSICVCSNVEGYSEAKTFVLRHDESGLVRDFVDYIGVISQKSREILDIQYRDIFEEIDTLAERLTVIESEFSECNFSSKEMYDSRDISKMKQKLVDYLAIIPVVSFNGGRYDINVMKGPLLKHLHNTGKIKFTVKRNSNMQCIQTDSFKIVDVINFIAPNYSYDKYLKAYGCDQTKGFFPYEWLTDPKKLEQTFLPPHNEFYSSLKQSNISEEEYQSCVKVWNDKKMKTMVCYLKHYSELDVAPFLQALEKQTKIYQQKGIDMLKSAISLPGLAIRWLFSEVDRDSFDIPLIDEKNRDVYDTIKANLTGGPSIIFHRYHEAGKTKIREQKLGSAAKPCAQILGVDANALYLHSLMQGMPTSFLVRRREENRFKPEMTQRFGRQALAWLTFLSEINGVHIKHQFNSGEKRVGKHGIPVDGFSEETNTVYQFHGCLFHGHPNPCPITQGLHVNPVNNEPLTELYSDTLAKEAYIRAQGFQLISIFECQWQSQLELDIETRQFIHNHTRKDVLDRGAKSMDEILQLVLTGEVFGFIECDIHVPSELTEKFSEMSPIFKNVNVSRADLSEHMRDFASDTDHLRVPQRMLIGSLRGEKILLSTELVKWYLEHGLVVTRIYQVMQYECKRPFERFGQSVSQARREGDTHPSFALRAETSKLVGNSAFGKTITNQERHRQIKYVDDDRKAGNYIKCDRFVSMDEITSEFYEMTLLKVKTTVSTPYIVGMTVLMHAKLRMLQFYYDFMDRFFDRSDFEYIEMDTDSAYMACSGSLESIVKPHMKKQFYVEYGEWFPKPFCSFHETNFIASKLADREWEMEPCCKAQLAYDKRTPGLFKTEFTGEGMIALNSKTYYCWSEDDSKTSSKGLSKSHNKLTRSQFMDVLKNRNKISGINRGFLFKNRSMYTYEQSRAGLTYFYAKRKVQSDGVTTHPLDI